MLSTTTVDIEINPIVTEAVHVNANSVPEFVHRVRSVQVSQPVSISSQSQGTLPDFERFQLTKEAHFDSQAKSFNVQKSSHYLTKPSPTCLVQRTSSGKLQKLRVSKTTKSQLHHVSIHQCAMSMVKAG